VPKTNVLETTFTTRGGTVVVRDLMPVASEDDKHRQLLPEHELLRELQCLQGEVLLEIAYQPRPDYARAHPALQARGKLGIWLESGPAMFILNSDLRLGIAPDKRSAQAAIGLKAGERRYISLSYSQEAPAVTPALGAGARARIERSIAWWQGWAGGCTYQGPYAEAVMRSLLTLKLMTYAPSGAIVAAPTTSLPEALGGVRNWDYRYCWLRDASLTIRALLEVGYEHEAAAFCSWLLDSTRLTLPELQVVYDVFGRTHLAEHELPELDGYAGSRPVRTGNDAHGQLQLDVYGELIDGIARYLARGDGLDKDTQRMLRGLGETVCRRWQEPDEGIWEVRSGRFHHTHSKVLCWVALDRLITMHHAGRLVAPVERFTAAREAIRADVEAHGYNPRIDSYTSTFGGDEVDASLLLLPLYGYVPAADPRMRATHKRIHEQLARGPFLYRYLSGGDGLPGQEGAFGIASFWAIEVMARAGEVAEARAQFEQVLSHANDLGLYAEEFDPATGEALGNFPQAFTHIGLINAALTLAECEEGGHHE
jgi:GH15 family glucan-1,4-alpha-glucosidase